MISSWKDYANEIAPKKMDIIDLTGNIDESWDEIFFHLTTRDPRIQKINITINNDITQNSIYPPPNLVFRAFEIPMDKIKVVIIGQDPYINENDQSIPQAMGLSFSVPDGFPIPPSLKNIYKNLHSFGHLRRIPNHGNLEALEKEGVFLLNSSLTVKAGISNSHAFIWTWFTDEIITHINKLFPEIIFVLFGRNAISKSSLLIPGTKILSCSHPSPLGCNKKCGDFPSFNTCDFAKDLGIDWNVLL